MNQRLPPENDHHTTSLPAPQAFLRIDDFPATGYEFALLGRANDENRLRRLKKLVGATSDFGVIPEFMVCSHVMDPAGKVFTIDVVYPKTTALMRRLVEEGKITVNAHGMFHLHEDLYVRTGKCDALEFVGLGEAETARKLDAICQFIRRVFRKEPRGFVAPAWGYEPGVTKRIASRYFDYIADSYDSWRQGVTPAFGTVDSEYGFVHFPETWRYGAYSLTRSDPTTWRGTIRQGLPIHVMQHGFRIPSEWRSILEERLPQLYGLRVSNLAIKYLASLARSRHRRRLLVGTTGGAVSGVAAAWIAGGKVRRFFEVAGFLGLLVGVIPLVARRRTARTLVKDLHRANLRSILAAGAAAGVRWGTLEGYASAIKAHAVKP